MAREQKYVLAAGLLALAIVFTYVPFQSNYNERGDNPKAYEGYSFLWDPPQPIAVCIKTFGWRYPVSNPERIVQEANKRCSVSPLYSRILISALATTLLTLAIYLVVGVMREKKSPAIASNPPKVDPLVPRREPNTQQSLAHVLLSELGPSFPISTGNAMTDDPLIITASRDYVSVEYAVVRHVLGKVRESYELDAQALLNRDGRQIDELVFKVKSAGAADWTGRRSFYFDITEGFSKLG